MCRNLTLIFQFNLKRKKCNLQFFCEPERVHYTPLVMENDDSEGHEVRDFGPPVSHALDEIRLISSAFIECGTPSKVKQRFSSLSEFVKAPMAKLGGGGHDRGCIARLFLP